MIKQDLDVTLKEFREKLGVLVSSPSLESALEANLVSLKVKDELMSIASIKGFLPREILHSYSVLVDQCIRKIDDMIPISNGYSRHLELYSEQMLGRTMLLERMNCY